MRNWHSLKLTIIFKVQELQDIQFMILLKRNIKKYKPLQKALHENKS